MNEKTAQIGKDSDGLVSARVHGNYTMPAPNSQCAEILEELRKGHSLTTYQIHAAGIQSATARIKDLRDMGWPIVCILEPHINKHRKKVWRGRYHLATAQEADA